MKGKKKLSYNKVGPSHNNNGRTTIRSKVDRNCPPLNNSFAQRARSIDCIIKEDPRTRFLFERMFRISFGIDQKPLPIHGRGIYQGRVTFCYSPDRFIQRDINYWEKKNRYFPRDIGDGHDCRCKFPPRPGEIGGTFPIVWGFHLSGHVCIHSWTGSPVDLTPQQISFPPRKRTRRNRVGQPLVRRSRNSTMTMPLTYLVVVRLLLELKRTFRLLK